MAAWIVLLSLSLPLQTPEGDSPLADELESRVLKQGPIRCKISLEKIDAAGKKSPSDEIDLYLNLSAGEMAFRTLHLRPDEEALYRYMVYDRQDRMTNWQTGGHATRMNMRPLWEFMHVLTCERNRLLEPDKAAPDYDDWANSIAGWSFFLDVKPQEDGTQATFQLALGRTSPARIGWLAALRAAGKDEVSETAEEVTLKSKGTGKITVIYRRTGFLRSLQLPLASGESRRVTVSEFASGAAKPEYAPPEDPREVRMWAEDLPAYFPDGYYGHLAGLMQGVLNHWEVVGTPGRSRDLDTFLTSVAARHDSANRFAAARFWTGTFLADLARRGGGLPEPDGELGTLVNRLKRYVARGEKDYERRFSSQREQFLDRLEDVISKLNAPRDARDSLFSRMARAAETALVETVRAGLPEPDFEGLLRESLRSADSGEPKAK